MFNSVVGLDSRVKISGANTGFKVMRPSIGLFISCNFGYMLSINLKGEILYETRQNIARARSRTSAAKA